MTRDGLVLYRAAVATSDEKLGALSEQLAEQGADPERIDLVERARRFKRSWVDMAEGLLRAQASQAYERWGYPDLHAYCNHELQLKRATVDKLMGSYATIREHAPQILRNDSVEHTIPSYDAVDYFARALRQDAANDAAIEPDGGVIEELRSAVFEDARPISALRRQFNPILHPKQKGEEALSALERARGNIKRLTSLLEELGTDAEAQVARVEEELAVIEDLVRNAAGSTQLAS